MSKGSSQNPTPSGPHDSFGPVDRMLREEGVLDGEGPNGPSTGDKVADALNSLKPKIQLPGDNRLLMNFAKEIADVMRVNGVYRRDVVPVVAYAQRGRIEPLTPESFRSLVERHLVCYKRGRSGEDIVQICRTMPIDAARGVLTSWDFWPGLPEIERINGVRQPVLRRGGDHDGQVELLVDGYDADTRTLTFAAGISYDETMSLEGAREVFDGLLGEFPFAEQATETGRCRSKAVVLAGMLTMFAGGLMPREAARPAFIYNSNSQRAGKSLLAKMAIIPVCGGAALTSMPKKDEEMKKTLDAEVLAASPSIFFDNVKGHVSSQVLEGFITTPLWKGRVLGKTQMFEAEQGATVFITGNDCTVSTDIALRSLFVDLFVEEADVNERTVSRVIDDALLKHPATRREVLSAMWALVKSWDAAGRPKSTGRLKGFESWVETIGGLAAHAGYGDPLEAPEIERGGDTSGRDMKRLVAALAADVEKTQEWKFAEVVEKAIEEGLFDWILKAETPGELKADARSSFGKVLKGQCGRVFFDGKRRRVRFGDRGKKQHKHYSIEVLVSSVAAEPL